jgi:hypothetical protein
MNVGIQLYISNLVNYNAPRHINTFGDKGGFVSKKFVTFVEWSLIAIFILAAGYFGYLGFKQQQRIMNSITVGRTFPAEKSPYPVSVFVIDKIVNKYTLESEINGDLYIDLPIGSEDPQITRWPGADGLNCGFEVEYTSADGTRTSLTWNDCVQLKGYDVVPHQIEVR